MEQLLEFFRQVAEIPWYAWIGGFFAVGLMFGKKKDWEYEAKLFKEDRQDSMGEIEIKQYKGEVPQANLQLHSFDCFYGNDLEIQVEGKTICRVELSEDGRYVTKQYPLMKSEKQRKFRGSRNKSWSVLLLGIVNTEMPANNQKVEILCHGKALYTGVLFKD